MKKLIENYTFDASAKTITILCDCNFTLDKLLVITNVTDGVIIYNFADSNLTGSITGNIITLSYDTTSMSDTDILQIWVEDTNPLLVTLSNFLNIIRNAVGKLSFDQTNQLRTNTTVSTVSSVTTVTTANAGFGDLGKPITSTMVINQAYNVANSKNFVRS